MTRKKRIVISFVIIIILSISIFVANRYWEYLKEKDLEERFGSVTLEEDEIESMAKDIVYGDKQEQLAAPLTEKTIIAYMEWVLNVEELVYDVTMKNDFYYVINSTGYIDSQEYSGVFYYLDEENGVYEEIHRVIDGIEYIE